MKSFLALVGFLLIAAILTGIFTTPPGLAANYTSRINWGEEPATCNQSTIYVTSISNSTGPSCWGLFLPSSEGGNETSELALIHQDPNRFKVIVLDDYAYEDAVVKNLSSQNITPIPVLYPYELMNLTGLQSLIPFTTYTILAISPYDMILFRMRAVNCYTSSCLAAANVSISAWENMISYYSRLVSTKSHLILLEYLTSPSFWRYQIPANYSLAMQNQARLQNVALIAWS